MQLDDERYEEIRDRLVGRLRRALDEAAKANAELAAFEQAHEQGLAALVLRAGVTSTLELIRDGCWQLEVN